MDIEEAKRRLREAGVEGYFEPEDRHADAFLLGGWYSLKDLEAILGVMRELHPEMTSPLDLAFNDENAPIVNDALRKLGTPE